MVTKRYTSKYKVLSRYKQPIWLEKRGKIKKFKKKKWESLKKIYFPKRYKFFSQDVASYPTSETYESERSVRLKKTYKFILQDKQRFQLYYGGGRLKLFQIKKLANNAVKFSKNKNISSSKIFLHFFERRLDTALYRLGLTSSLMQARRLINSEVIRSLSAETVLKRVPKLALQNKDSIIIDPAWFPSVLARYLKVNVPFFYFRNNRLRKESIFHRQDSFHKSFLTRNNLLFLKLLRSQLVRIKK